MKRAWRRGAITAGLVGGGLALWSGAIARAAEAAVPQDGRLVDVPGGRLHVVDSGGTGPVLVMLHGLYGQLRNFSYALSERMAADHRVILVDRPGWGWSRAHGAQPTLAEQARMIAALLDALHLSDVLLVGHSMGGALALAVALDHPERLRGLALIAPLTQEIEHTPRMVRGRTAIAPLRTLAAWTVATPLAMVAGPAAARRIFAPEAVPADFATRGGGALAIRPGAVQAGAAELTGARAAIAALAPRYPDLSLPVAMLFGRDDRILDPDLHGAASRCAAVAARRRPHAAGDAAGERRALAARRGSVDRLAGLMARAGIDSRRRCR